MAPQLLFYERAVPISSETHRDVSIEGPAHYGFANAINAVPLTTPEIAVAAAEYAVVFVGQGDDVVPAVVLGVRDGQNLFVDGAGRWQANYVPAFIRRYPFVFATGGAQGGAEAEKRLLLCLDEASAMVNRDGRGERLFDSTGTRTAYLDNVLQFMQRFQAAFAASQQMARRLNSLELLQPVQVQLRGPGGELQLRGFMTVDRQRLKALQPETVRELFASDALEGIYLHLASLRNLQRLGERSLATKSDAQAPDNGLNEGDILLD